MFGCFSAPSDAQQLSAHTKALLGGDAPALVKDGGKQIYPPLVLPRPEELDAEVRAWRPNRQLRRDGLGLFACFKDYQLLRFFKYLKEKELLALSETSKYMFMFTEDEERWKRLTILNRRGDFLFKGTWKRTCLMPRYRDHNEKPLPDIRLEGFYSPYMYENYYRANVSMEYFRTIPKTTVDRRHNLSYEEFVKEYLIPNKPVVISGHMDKWPAASEWTVEKLSQKYGAIRFKTDEVDAESHKFKMRFTDYVQYMLENQDEDPIYMFDPCFDERAPKMLKDYRIPEYFQEDFFAALGEDRPDFMWLVLGPSRSGSPFHVDPYKTSAWNAVFQGRKRWALYPPDVDPPGVPVEDDSEDGIDYDAPEPIKYFVEEYSRLKPSQLPMEIIQEPGEFIYVPSGWWHMVLNLEPCVAVTQNFCSTENFDWVINDMKLPSNKKIYRNFRRVMAPLRPDLAKKYGFQQMHFEHDA